jgi:hypothetical protein
MAKRKVQQDNDLQNTTQKTKDRATQTPLSIDWRRNDNTMAKGKGQQDKQWSTKHYTEN